MNIEEVKALGASIRAEIAKAVVGQGEAVDLIVAVMQADGH